MAKKNMSLTKVPMPEQAPDVRNKNFDEVALGYTAEMAMEEATRCLNCKNKPCVGGCPVNVPIPGFIEKGAEAIFKVDLITLLDNLPTVSMGVFLAIVIIVSLLMLLVSMKISLSIMNKKEFQKGAIAWTLQ